MDASTETALVDLPIERLPPQIMTNYLRSSSTASDRKVILLNRGRVHALEKVCRRALIECDYMEVDADTNIITLLDLPIESLTHVASFLTTTTRALFTVALARAHADASRKIPCTWCRFELSALSADRIAALGRHQWDVLDFGDVDKALASRLCDNDIHAVLLLTDAVNRTRILRISNCTNITGSCLEPLRGSLSLEKIDLSLVGDNQSPKISPPPSISFTHVLPILDSIIQRGNNRLSHIQFPHISRDIVLGRSSDSTDFRHFVTRYNQMWKKRGVVGCAKCNADINACSDSNKLNSNRWMHIFGTQFNTCYSCMKHYCDDCSSKVLYDENGRVDSQMLAFCTHCHKYYCADCKRMERCQVGIGCDKYVCSDCNFFEKCSGCHWKMCGDCHSERREGSCNNEAYCDFCEIGTPCSSICTPCSPFEHK